MLKQLMCMLWGCKVVTKVETGRIYLVKVALFGLVERPLKEFKVQPFCLRCGKPNQYYSSVPAVGLTPGRP